MEDIEKRAFIQILKDTKTLLNKCRQLLVKSKREGGITEYQYKKFFNTIGLINMEMKYLLKHLKADNFGRHDERALYRTKHAAIKLKKTILDKFY